MAKTWLPSKICQLMAAEMKSYRHDCSLYNKPWSDNELSERIYLILHEKCLIEHTP